MAGDTKAFTIAPGGSHPINGNGQTFLFCKFADRDVTVDIGGNKVTMRPGSYQEFEPMSGPRSRFTFYNEDPDNPAAVVFIMGTGTYDEKIITGEITVAPGVRKADGRFSDDTRQSISMTINPVYGYAGEQIAVGDVTKTLPFVGTPGFSAPQTKYGEFHYDQGTLIVSVGSIVADERGLFRLKNDLSGWEKITVPDEPFEVQSPPVFTPCAPAGGGYLRRSTNFSFKERIYAYDNQALTNVEVIRAPWDVGSMTYDPQRDEVYVKPLNAVDGKVLRVYRVDGLTSEFLREIDISHLWQSSVVNTIQYIRFNPQDRTFTLGEDKTSGTNVAVTDEEFNLIQAYDLDPLDGTATGGGLELIKIGDYFYGAGEDDGDVLQVAATASELTLRGFAAPVGCDVTLIDPSYENVATTAAISLQDLNGRSKVTGEVIKAALELFYRRALGANYMDSVYKATFYQPVGGEVLKTVGNNAGTLARLGVEDNFSVYFPSRVDLTIDADLPLIEEGI